MNTDKTFSVILHEYDPKDIRSHNILRFFVEDLTENEKIEFVAALFYRNSWILPTEISKISDSIRLKNYTKNTFLEIFNDWTSKRINFSNSLKIEIKNYFIPATLLLEYREVLFSIRNLNFPDELMLVYEKLICESNANYLNKYFAVSFWEVIEDFSTEEIEIFFTYFANLYIKGRSSNLKSFLYYFLNGLAYSSKIFLLSQKFIILLKSLSTSIFENNAKNDYTTIISFLLIELIEKKELDLSDYRFNVIVKDTLAGLKKGDFDNLDFYRFLEHFNYPFNDFDFNIEVKSLFEKLRTNIYLANNSDLRKKCSLAHHYIMSADDYCELLYFYLEHCTEVYVNLYFIEFVKLVDDLRISFSSLLWFDEYLNFDTINGKIIGVIPEGFSVEIDKDEFNKKIVEKDLIGYCTEEFVSQYGYGFLNFKSLKDFPRASGYYASGKTIAQKKSESILEIAKVSKSEPFFILKVNYSITNQWTIATLFPYNNILQTLVAKYEIKALFTPIELFLIEKAHIYLGIESPFLKKTTILNRISYFKHDYKINFNELQFWDLFKKLRPSLFEKIYINHQKSEDSFDRVVNAYENNQTVMGLITMIVKGGLSVDILGKEAFLPGSQIDFKTVIDFNTYVGKTMDFRILKVDKKFKNVVISHKALIEEQNLNQKERALSKLEKGSVMKGRVKNITNYGVFVDLGGFDGLIYISDLSWGRINHLDEIVKLDDEINVLILDFDNAKSRISLGLKQLTNNPWDANTFIYNVGDIVVGKVVDIVIYGAFIEIESGIEGLVHVSEIIWNQTKYENVNDLLKIGDDVVAIIQTIDRKERKMSLSIKELTPDPWFEKYAQGTIHRAVILKILNYGIIVQLNNGPEGMIHNSKYRNIKKLNIYWSILRLVIQ